MRKLISMSVMALLLSVMASTAIAGNVEDCEILKDGDYSKGLYGLCIAWHNAGNDNARGRILANYDKKATGPNDPPLPGSVPSGPSCPCLDALAGLNDYDWGVSTTGCFNDGGYDFSFFVNNPPDAPSFNFTTLFATDSDGETAYCAIQQSPDTNIMLNTTMLEYDECLRVLLERCSS